MGCRLDGGVIGTGGDGRGGIGDGGDIEELIKSEDERNKPIITGGSFVPGYFSKNKCYSNDALTLTHYRVANF